MQILPTTSFHSLIACVLGCTAAIMLIGCDAPELPNGAPNEPKGIQIEHLPFADKSVRDRLLSIDRMARRIAKPNMQHKAWYKVTHEGDSNPWSAYRTMWSTHGLQQELIITPGTRSLHRIRLSATVDREDGKTVKMFTLHAIWFPKPGEWGANITYYAYPKSKESYSIHFYPGKHRFDSDSLRTLRMTEQFGDYHYWIDVDAAKKDARGYLVSAKSFRDQGLAGLKELSALVQKQIESGDAISYVTDDNKVETKIVGGKSGGHPPREEKFPVKFRPPLPKRYQLNAAQKKQILDEASEELNRRRKLLVEHYEAMYAATQKAFPLAKCLKLGP